MEATARVSTLSNLCSARRLFSAGGLRARKANGDGWGHPCFKEVDWRRRSPECIRRWHHELRNDTHAFSKRPKGALMTGAPHPECEWPKISAAISPSSRIVRKLQEPQVELSAQHL
jgi:hypothetical protein